MANDSSVSGFLSPLPDPAPAPLEGLELLKFFQQWFVGLTNLQGSLIRPRWQSEAPNIPDSNTDWISFGITKRTPDTYAAELHSPENEGYNELRRHEQIDILVSAYGPNCSSIASILRDGMQIAQNREILSLNDMGLIGSGDSLQVPELVKETWYRREDFSIWIRRQIRRHYGVLNLLEADGTLDNELYIESITVRSTP